MKTERIAAVEKGKVSLQSFDVGEPGEGEVLVREFYTTISPGTEVAFLHGMMNTPNQFPFYPGYNACGRVEAVGPGVTTLKAGDIVSQRGSHSRYNIVPAGECVIVPEGVDSKEASLFLLGSIALQGVRKAEIQLGDKVAVIGLGPVGNLALQFSKIAGAGIVDGFDISQERRAFAMKTGADHVYENISDQKFGGCYDIVIEASGARGVVQPACTAACWLGKVILLGCTRALEDGINFYLDIHKRGIRVIGAHEFCRMKEEDGPVIKTFQTDYATTLAFMAQKRLRGEALISAVYNPEKAQEAYDRLFNRDPSLMLVTFDWN